MHGAGAAAESSIVIHRQIRGTGGNARTGLGLCNLKANVSYTSRPGKKVGSGERERRGLKKSEEGPQAFYGAPSEVGYHHEYLRHIYLKGRWRYRPSHQSLTWALAS